MASRTQTGSRFGRRIIWLAFALAVLVLAYTGAWFYMAHSLESRIAAAITEINGNGVRAYCEEPEARGYPFRIGLFCRSVFYEDVADGVSVRAGAFRSAANVYQPFRVVGEVDSPAAIALPHFMPMEAHWENLRASARLAEPLPERISLEGRAVKIFAKEGDGAPLATLAGVTAHARQQGTDLETAISFRDLLLGEEIASDLPLLEGRALFLIDEGVRLLASETLEPYGQSGVIQELVIGLAGQDAGISLSGPVSVDEDGLIDAELSLQIRDPSAAMQLAAKIFPEARDKIMTASSVAAGLGNAPMTLRIERGRAFVGFIPIGRIPPI